MLALTLLCHRPFASTKLHSPPRSRVDPGVALVVSFITLQFGKLAPAQTKPQGEAAPRGKILEPGINTFGRGSRALYQNDSPCDFDPVIASTVS